MVSRSKHDELCSHHQQQMPYPLRFVEDENLRDTTMHYDEILHMSHSLKN